MKAIWKFPLVFTPNGQEIKMPKGAVILTAQVQSATMTLWAAVDPSEPEERRVIEILATGQLVEDRQRSYIGTVQVGSLVWHVFERVM